MSESILINQLNILVDNTVDKIMGVSKHLMLFVYICIGLLIISVFFASTLYLAIPFLIFSCIPLFFIFRLAQKLVNVQKLKTGREEFIRLVNNQDSIKEKLKSSFDDPNSSIGKGKTKIKTKELIERAKLFLSVKEIIKAKNLKTGATIEIASAISSIALLGNPFYILFIGVCYFWLIFSCLGSVFTIVF